MISIERLQNIVNTFSTLTRTQKEEAIICFREIIETVSDKEVKNILTEFVEVLNEEIA